MISPPLRAAGNPDALWAGLADGVARARRHGPRAGPGRGREAELAGVVRPDLERRAGDRDAARRWPGTAGVAAGRIPVERMVDVLSTTPARAVRAADEGRDRGRPRRGPRAVRPGRAADDPGRRPPPHERLHAVRGPRGARRGALDDRPRRRSSSATASSWGAAASGGSWNARSGARLTVRRSERPPVGSSVRDQSSRRYASGVRNSAKSSARTRPSRRAAASATRPASRPIRSSSSSRIRAVAGRRRTVAPSSSSVPWRRHCHSWER